MGQARSPSVTKKNEGGLHTFLQMFASGGYIPPLTKSGKKLIFIILHRSFGGLRRDGNDKSIQHRGVNSMRMSYHIDQKCMKPTVWGGNLLKTMKNVCKQGCADLWLQNLQSASHSRNIFSSNFIELCRPDMSHLQFQLVVSVWNLSMFFVEQLSGDSLENPWGLNKHKVLR